MKHGVRTSYVKGCRCTDCRAANCRYAKLVRYRRETGRSTLMDSAPVRRHLQQLRAAGVGKRTIARRSGVSATVINRLLGVDGSKPAKRVRPSTAQRLLAVTADQVADGTCVDGMGTIRRLQALVAIGYTQTALGKRLGWTTSNLNRIVLGHQQLVSASTARMVAQLYDELSMTPASSTRSRNLAARKGWAPPLAWDDDAIDDPDAVPHVDGVPSLRSGGRRPIEIVEDFHDTWDYHGGDADIAAARLGMSRNTLEKNLSRARQAGVHVRTRENAA